MSNLTIDAIITRCNQINPQIGTGVKVVYTADFNYSVLTTGNFILKISDEAIQDQNARVLSEERIHYIVSNAKKKYNSNGE